MTKQFFGMNLLGGLVLAGFMVATPALAGEVSHKDGGGKYEYKHNDSKALHVVSVPTGKEEVPEVKTKTFGNFQLKIDKHNKHGKFSLWAWNGKKLTEAHLHCGPMGENGPVVVTLWSKHYGKDVHGLLARGTIKKFDIVPTYKGDVCPEKIYDLEDLRKVIEKGLIYVNVHSKEYPDGVMRAQLYVGTKVFMDQVYENEVHYSESEHDNGSSEEY